MRALAVKWRWRTARFVRFDIMFVAAFLAAVATIRGSDYISAHFSAEPDTPALKLVEAAFPLWMWGAWFLAGALILASGMLTRIHPAVFLGHVVLFVAYGTLGLALVLTLPNFWPPTGVRTAAGMGVPAALHFLYAFRMGPRPIDSDRQHVREAVVSE